jgi:hypothetical protein
LDDVSSLLEIVVDAKATPAFEIENFERVHSLINNTKTSLTIGVSGEGLSEDIYFEGLSDEVFIDNIVGQTHIDFRFVPVSRHLHKNKTKPIAVSFLTKKLFVINRLKLYVRSNNSNSLIRMG